MAELRALERLDAELAAESERLGALDDGVAELRRRAEELADFAAGHDDEARRRGAAVEAARVELARREELAAACRADLERAVDDAEQLAATRALERAVDRVVAERAEVARLESAGAELAARAAGLPDELAMLVRRADHLSAAVSSGAAVSGAAVSRAAVSGAAVSGAATSLVEWAAAVHAELFVSVRQLAAHRDRLAREANELASMLLGEPTHGSTVAQALARVDAAAGRAHR